MYEHHECTPSLTHEDQLLNSTKGSLSPEKGVFLQGEQLSILLLPLLHIYFSKIHARLTNTHNPTTGGGGGGGGDSQMETSQMEKIRNTHCTFIITVS